MRSANPPFKTWRELGHLPFEMFGEQFAVTRNPAMGLFGATKWKVSHVASGIAIPRSGSDSQEVAVRNARNELEYHGEAKFKAALAKAREAIACGQ